MSELGYEREYRPSSLNEYVGNMRVKEELKSMLASKYKPHFILISGQSGLGKTTLARIIAKEVRCANRDVHKGSCNECQSCKQFNTYIKTGTYEEIQGFTEVDNGRYSKIEGVRSLLDEFAVQSVTPLTRIAILDEIQTLSRAAQDAMLKTLEEPPENTLFILCTTAPEYLQRTILNRAKPHIVLTKPTTPELVRYLSEILTKEGLKYDQRGLEIIASRNDNIPRNSVIALEGIITHRGEAMHDKVMDVLDHNNVTDELFFDFYASILETETKAMYLILLDKVKKITDLNTFVDKLLTFTKRGLYIHNGVNIDGLSKEEMKKYKTLFNKFSIEQVSNLLQHIVNLKKGDVESNLFILGYADLAPTLTAQTHELAIDSTSKSTELKQETQIRTLSKKKQKQEAELAANEQIKTLNKTANIDDVMAMFQSTTEDLEG